MLRPPLDDESDTPLARVPDPVFEWQGATRTVADSAQGCQHHIADLLGLDDLSGRLRNRRKRRLKLLATNPILTLSRTILYHLHRGRSQRDAVRSRGIGRARRRARVLAPRARARGDPAGRAARAGARRCRGQHAAMRAPFQEGEFPGPVKYGYLNVGSVEQGPPELRGRTVFCLYPHQTAYVVPAGAVTVVPDDVPPARAVLAGTVETAVNAL